MSSGNIVKLNIGGSIFQTTRSTLTKFDGFFKTMLETDIPLEKDENGAIFIDRDPKHFRFILNYMRDGCVNIPDSKAATQEIQTEAQFYLLDGLVKLCNTQKPVSDKKIDPFPKSTEEFTYAIVNSTKKAVILVPYRVGGGTDESSNAEKTSKILMKYGADFDVFFFSYESTYTPGCRICDMSTGKWEQSGGGVHLDRFMKERYGVE